MNKNEQIKLKDAYCQLIVDLGVDYNGYNSVKDLKMLIDTLVCYAQKAINNDDRTIIYIGENEQEKNIFLEDIY